MGIVRIIDDCDVLEAIFGVLKQSLNKLMGKLMSLVASDEQAKLVRPFPRTLIQKGS